MDLNKIGYFKVVAEIGSISHAGPVVGLSQPALSLQIQDLESEVGVKLFNRSNRGLKLTDEGRALYERSILLDDWKSETQDIIDGLKKPSGVLRVASYTTASSYLLAPILKQFFKKYPSVQISFDYSETKVALEKVKSLEIDCAIMSEVPDLTGIEKIEICRSELILAGSSKNKKIPKKITTSQISDFPFLSYPILDDYCYAEVDRRYGEYFRKASNPISSISFDTLKMGLIEDLGISFVPEYIVRQEIKAKKLRRVEISGPKLPIQFSFASKSKRVCPPKLKVFKEFILDQFGRRRD